jgi:hypothetical protein
MAAPGKDNPLALYKRPSEIAPSNDDAFDATMARLDGSALRHLSVHGLAAEKSPLTLAIRSRPEPPPAHAYQGNISWRLSVYSQGEPH